jgi:hypothetical protein
MENENVALSLINQAVSCLPSLLSDEAIEWQTRFVDFSYPSFRQLACRWNNGLRLVLHEFYRGDVVGPLNTHHHPWAHAVRILEGGYRMRVGSSPPSSSESAAACVLDLFAGASFSMVHPDGWHSITPLTDRIIAVMITDKPWDFMQAHVPRSPTAIRTLSKEEVDTMKKNVLNVL